jgi:hypothetical protein
MADEARQAFEAGRYADAVDLLKAAERLAHAPLHLIYQARMLSQLGRLVEAHDVYRRVAAEPFTSDAPAALQQARVSALQEYVAIERRIPRLAIVLVGESRDEVRVTVDGKLVPKEERAYPVRVDPGAHEIAAEIAGAWAVRHRVVLPEGRGTYAVRLVLPEAASQPAPSGSAHQGISGWMVASLVGLGLGGTALTASVPLGILSMQDEDLQGAALGTLLAGGLLVVGCGAWFMGLAASTGPAPGGPDPARSTVHIEPTVGPRGIGLRGRF